MPSDEVEFICADARHRAELLLERPRDELFHLERPDARVVDAHVDRRLRDVRQQIHRQPGQRDAAQQDDDRADHRHHHRTLNGKARNAHTDSSKCSSLIGRHNQLKSAIADRLCASDRGACVRIRLAPALAAATTALAALALVPGAALTARRARAAAPAAPARLAGQQNPIAFAQGRRAGRDDVLAFGQAPT